MENRVETVSARVFVETPELVSFSFETAGLGRRLLAYLLDMAIRVALMIVIGVGISIADVTGMGVGVLLVVYFVIEWLYFTVLEWGGGGATPGKRVVGIRVVRRNGTPVDLYRSAMRNLLRVADSFPGVVFLLGTVPHPSYGLGLLFMFVVGQNRRLGDWVADTMVVAQPDPRLASLPPLPDDVPELSWHQLTSVGLLPADLVGIDAFFRRMPRMGVARANEIAQYLARPLREKLGLGDVEATQLLGGVLLAGHRETRMGASAHLTMASR